MPRLLAQVRIPHRSNLPQDVMVNTFAFDGIDDVEDMCTAIFGRLNDFYDTTQTSGQKLTFYMSSALNTAGTRLQVYDLADSPPRVPVFDESLGLSSTPTTGDTSNLPSEVALCLSYRAALESGTNPRRRRGRIYFGPLNSNGLDAVVSSLNPGRPSTTFRQTLAQAGTALAGENTLGAQWSVWSRADNQLYEIVAGWVDNSYDSQRRRGEIPTSRINWAPE